MTPTAEQTALLQRSLDHITAHPEDWDQGTWAEQTPCGTVACLAGTALRIAGIELRWYKHCGDPHADTTADGRTIREVAAQLLGLDDEADDDQNDADILFSGDNTLADLWDLAVRINPAIVPPAKYAENIAGRDVARAIVRGES